jgi:hypothetical protein
MEHFDGLVAGTGKTSTVLAIARQLYGKNMHNMVLELNASDDRGIGVVRLEIQDFASTRSVFSKCFKLVILDECDAMTKDAQFALRRVIEKYARYAPFPLSEFLNACGRLEKKSQCCQCLARAWRIFTAATDGILLSNALRPSNLLCAYLGIICDHDRIAPVRHVHGPSA